MMPPSAAVACVDHMLRCLELDAPVSFAPSVPLPQGKYQEAEPLFRRSLMIAEIALGKDHPHFSTSLNNLAALLHRRVRAQPLRT